MKSQSVSLAGGGSSKTGSRPATASNRNQRTLANKASALMPEGPMAQVSAHTRTVASSGKGITEKQRAEGHKAKNAASKKTQHLDLQAHNPASNAKERDAGIHLTQILSYYRGRVEAFERDRTQWYAKLEDVRIK